MQIPTHAMAGWLMSQPLVDRRDRQLVTLAAVIADLDGLTLLGGLDYYQKYHHTFGHNIFAWLITTGLCTFFSRSRLKATLFCSLAYGSHIIFDLLGSGHEWPIQLWWPLSVHEYYFAPPLQWELASWQNFSIGICCLATVIAIGIAKGRTILEVFSVKADQQIVKVIRKRFR